MMAFLVIGKKLSGSRPLVQPSHPVWIEASALGGFHSRRTSSDRADLIGEFRAPSANTSACLSQRHQHIVVQRWLVLDCCADGHAAKTAKHPGSHELARAGGVHMPHAIPAYRGS